MAPRPPARGVDMFRNTSCATERTELSNALAVWTCDLSGTQCYVEPKVHDSFRNETPMRSFGYEPTHRRSPEPRYDAIFFSHFPRVVALKNEKVVSRGPEMPEVCLRTELFDF